MSCSIILDLETIPDQRQFARKQHITDARENFKAPAGITKQQMGDDLKLSASDIKFTAKAELQAQWEAAMGPKMYEAVGDENWRKTALDGGSGQIVAFAAKSVASGQIVSGIRRIEEDESGFLADAFAAINGLLGPDGGHHVPHFIGHNITFDLRFLYRRAVILGIKPPFKIKHNGRHGQDFFDNPVAWCGYKQYISQNDLCEALGIEGKPGDIDGSKVWDHIAAGDYARVLEYNIDDVEKAEAVYKRLTWTE